MFTIGEDSIPRLILPRKYMLRGSLTSRALRFPFLHSGIVSGYGCLQSVSPTTQRKNHKMSTDSQVPVDAMSNGKAKDPVLQNLAKENVAVAVSHDFEFQLVHIPGWSNTVADLLSRRLDNKATKIKFDTHNGTWQLWELLNTITCLDLQHLW